MPNKYLQGPNFPIVEEYSRVVPIRICVKSGTTRHKVANNFIESVQFMLTSSLFLVLFDDLFANQVCKLENVYTLSNEIIKTSVSAVFNNF